MEKVEIICQSILQWFWLRVFALQSTSNQFSSLIFINPGAVPFFSLIPITILPATQPPSVRHHHWRKKICQKSSIFEKYLQISFTALVHSNFLHLCCCPFWELEVDIAGAVGSKGEIWAGQGKMEIKDNSGRGPAAGLASPLPLPNIFGTFAWAQGPFVILRRQQEIALRCLSFLFFSFSVGCSLSQGQKMVKMLHYYFYYLFAFNTSRRGRRRWRWRCRKATTTMARTNVIQSQSGCRLLCILSRFYLCASCS